jgi:5-dehydro-2-deoxygluconokinase
MGERRLDVIALGRASVDLYGEQVGGRLEDVQSFAKYVGGCPANIAVGCARLGLKAALVSRVGDEHMGRFILETLEREGVDVSHVKTDGKRLTALVVLGIRDKETFPLIFFRADCADMAIEPDDVDAGFVASARALVATGTHFSAPGVEAASRAAIAHAKAAGTRVVLDIDYRPVLWGLAALDRGEDRFVAAARVTERLQWVVADCDVIVGTEEEFHIAGGVADTLEALAALRRLTGAVLVLKRGALGSAVFPAAIPASLEDGIAGRAFHVEVFNVLGAGDAFMSGFLAGWLGGEPWQTCATYGNACGALTVSRHGCAPAIPTWVELKHFLERGSRTPRVREDAELAHVHWATTRTKRWPEVLALALDSRAWLAAGMSQPPPVENLRRLNLLAWTAAREALGGRPGLGLVADGESGEEALFQAAGCWIARPVDRPGGPPLRFEGGRNVAVVLREWPAGHVVACRFPAAGPRRGRRFAEGVEALRLLFEACRATGHELQVELTAARPAGAKAMAATLAAVYEAGVRPDWWMLPQPTGGGGWEPVAAAVERGDPHCRGIVLSLLRPPPGAALRAARACRLCKGFAAGPGALGIAARASRAGGAGDDALAAAVADAFRRIVAAWDAAAPQATGAAAVSSPPWPARRP